jgi:adenylate cyclase
MTSLLEVALHNPRQHRQFLHADGPLLLVRSRGNGSMWTPVDKPAARRAGALLEITPQSKGVALALAGCEAEPFRNRSCCGTGDAFLPFPAVFSIDDTRFEIVEADWPASLDTRPWEVLFNDKGHAPGNESLDDGPSPATISRWFEAISSLNRWTMSLQELYAQATRCAVDAIGLDGAVLLRRRNEHWEIAASHLPYPELGIYCDRRALDELLRTPRTLFHGNAHTNMSEHNVRAATKQVVATGAMPAVDHNPQSAIPGTLWVPQCFFAPAVVISPLRSPTGAIVGAIYGYRSIRAGNSRRGIRYLEAHTIELLAGAVSEGIARLEHESEVERRRVLLEQTLVNAGDRKSQRVSSDRREVTLVFADLRGSTAITAALDMDQAYQLFGHVMDCLTTAVMGYDGLIIDYYGDGLSAMWNAPADQAEHAELACRAALRMLETLPAIAAEWSDVLPAGLRLGIGVHTGRVRVGNAGSRRRAKYGPRGQQVHIASRVETAAKLIQVPLLATRSTVERLSNRLAAHRVCRARVLGVKEPVDLFSVALATNDTIFSAEWTAYDTALGLFEQGRLADASAVLSSIAPSIGGIPARFLAEEVERAVNRQRRRRNTDRHGESDGIVEVGGK